MNTGLPMDETWVFPVILSLGLSIFATFWIAEEPASSDRVSAVALKRDPMPCPPPGGRHGILR